MSVMDPGAKDAKEYIDSYKSFATTLRTWLVAYGIGAPVLFTSQDAFSKLFSNKAAVLPVISSFLMGVCSQIMVSFLNKASMWYIMSGAMENKFKKTYRYRISNWFSEQFWIETLFDIFSISVFAYATVKVLILFSMS